MHYLLLAMSKIVKEYQLGIKEQLSNFSSAILKGNYKFGDNPSHTMLAKDEASHPINTIAGKMAMESSKDILISLSEETFLDGSLKEKNIDDLIRKTIIHPVKTNRFDDDVRDWAQSNPLNVLRSCLYSNYFETMRIGICLAQKYKKRLDTDCQNNETIGANRASKSSNKGEIGRASCR